MQGIKEIITSTGASLDYLAFIVPNYKAPAAPPEIGE
jgi:hypothetical protein